MEDCKFQKRVMMIGNINKKFYELLDELHEKAMPLFIADDLVKMFAADAKKIHNDYGKKRINRRQALERLEHLNSEAENIYFNIDELKENIFKVKKRTTEVLDDLIENPRDGVPFQKIISFIKEMLTEEVNNLPKKNFGMLEIRGDVEIDKVKKKILDFLDDYEAGVIALSVKQRDLIEDVSSKTDLNIEIKEEVSGNLIYTFGVSK